MARGEIFRFRLEEHERKKLDRLVAEKGLTSVADLIRDAFGLELAKRPATSTAKELAATPPSPAPVDRAAEPGKAAIEELAKKIRNREGKTTPAARAEAKKRLTKGHT